MLPCLVVDISEYENYFNLDTVTYINCNVHVKSVCVCVCIGQNYHIMAISNILKHPPS